MQAWTEADWMQGAFVHVATKPLLPRQFQPCSGATTSVPVPDYGDQSPSDLSTYAAACGISVSYLAAQLLQRPTSSCTRRTWPRRRWKLTQAASASSLDAVSLEQGTPAESSSAASRPPVVEVWRGSTPHVTQLRTEPTPSRDGRFFVDGANLPDGTLVHLLETDDSGSFAKVACDRGTGWLQTSYVRDGQRPYDADSRESRDTSSMSSATQGLTVWRGSEPRITQLRKWPSSSRATDEFHEDLLVADGEMADIVEVDPTGCFANIRPQRLTNRCGWIQLRYLRRGESVEEARQLLNAAHSHPRFFAERTWLPDNGPVEDIPVYDAFSVPPPGWPAVLADAAPRVQGSGFAFSRIPEGNHLDQFADFAHTLPALCMMHNQDARNCAREAPLVIQHTGLACAQRPVNIATFCKNGEEEITYLATVQDDLEGTPTPHACEPNIVREVIPPQFLPRQRATVSLLGESAGGILRREVAACGVYMMAVQGKAHVALLPPTVPASLIGSTDGDLGRGLASCDLFGSRDSRDHWTERVWHAELSAGDVLLVPPGWWFQELAMAPSTVITTSLYLTSALAPEALRSVSRWHSNSQPIETNDDENALDALRQFFTSLAFERPADGCMGGGGWTFPTRISSSTEAERFDDALQELVRENPGFCFGGVPVPSDAADWERQDLRRFILSGGYLSPVVRNCTNADLPESECLKAWWNTPIAQNYSNGWRPFGDAPKIIWMYWAQGVDTLTGFRRLCVHTWQAQNPDWRVVVLDEKSAREFVSPSELPRGYDDLEPAQQADALRLALLARYGGVYTDVTTICLKPLDTWVWSQVAKEPTPCGMGAFYVAWFGKERGVSAEYVENWFLASTKEHPFMTAWRDVYVAGWEHATSRLDYKDGPLFRHVDLSHITIEEHRTWLTMHICFKKLIDEDPELRRLWAEDMVLLRADDGAMKWMANIDLDRAEESAFRWAYSKDDAWVDEQLATAPMLKFVGSAANALQWQPVEHIVARDNCIFRILQAALQKPPQA
eukprot:TRINITY_DN36919_c0_g1_i2.p1 TRINITY_DN36919_c0_g1~~TRINITY_DN36919_c0_g1_i2.p1  ORF type:complete len:1015 (-),score=118.43 TRINITY_DN36919_c0_g1_i2:101-3145(-)